MIMYCFRLGILTTLLSDTLVQGFTCGSAVQVIGFQLKHLFGLSLPKRSGYFIFPYVSNSIAFFVFTYTELFLDSL